MKTVTLLSIAICSCNIFFASCKSMAQKNKDNIVVKSSERIACTTSGTYPLAIYSTYNVKLHESKVTNSPKLPKSYTTYKIDNKQLKTFFQSIKARGNGAINLPLPDAGCRSFTLSNSDVMNQSLADKYPNIISLKGHAADNNANTLRLDYDGRKMKATITWDNEVYFITPWEEGDTIYYLLYNKNDAGYEKVPFE